MICLPAGCSPPRPTEVRTLAITRPAADRTGMTATADERAAGGRAARKALPRTAHAEWAPASDRPDPVDTLEIQARARLPQLVPIRYGRMLTSPLAFYRGAAAIMAADLGAVPHSGLIVQLCGDAHLSNFGTFAGPDRRLLFDVDDFDETAPGPFEWDAKRLVASFEIAGRERGLSGAERREAVLGVGRSYRETMRRFAEMRTLEVWYARIDVEEIMNRWRAAASAKEIARVDKRIARARGKDHLRALAKLTEPADGRPRFRHEPPLLVPLSQIIDADEAVHTAELLRGWIRSYRKSLAPAHRALLDRFEVVDLAHKVVGVGSVGTRAWVLLMLGRDGTDPLVLQVKEAQASVLEPYVGAPVRGSHGRRVVEGQRLMQAASDIFLGWLSGTGLDGVQRDFYVRQLWDAKGSADVERMARAHLPIYAELCGAALARAHARSGDPIAIAAYLGQSTRFDRALASFAVTYADRNEQDFAALEAAASNGRVEVLHGV